jgi:hypothetical protein
LLSVIGLTATGCGGSQPVRRAPSHEDVATIGRALTDIVYQCQSGAAGFVASVDAASIDHDVDVLLRTYRRVRPSTPITIGVLHTTPRRELALASANLQMASCATGQARRLIGAVGH